MKIFNKIAIVGVGLMGGSLGLAIKDKGLSAEVLGISRKRKTLRLAKEKKAIDRGFRELSVLKDVDLVILATPVETIIDLAKKISKIISKDCLVTDVGSTKEKVVSYLDKLFPNYIGSHPLAGSEKRGIRFADKDIFKGSLCILTPTKNTSFKALTKIKRFWQMLGVKVVLLSPQFHDKVLSFISHLPHILAFSLINTTPKRFLDFAASGFKDTTRIASSDREIWQDIFLSNRRCILKAIDLFQQNLSKIKSAIKTRDKEFLNKFINQAKRKREQLK
ncbi:MAG: prephenate dehydrogenase [Candidatus Omnitrophica bacterium]|nr:prephenate dehydrogenase [Candidatus Omnitrophota bacterium]